MKLSSCFSSIRMEVVIERGVLWRESGHKIEAQTLSMHGNLFPDSNISNGLVNGLVIKQTSYNYLKFGSNRIFP